jgi:hypothetical protein
MRCVTQHSRVTDSSFHIYEIRLYSKPAIWFGSGRADHHGPNESTDSAQRRRNMESQELFKTKRRSQ